MNVHDPHPTIRVATLDDLPKWLFLAKERYPDRDVAATAKWVAWCIDHPTRLVLVGEATAGIASLDLLYGVDLRAQLDVIYSIPSLEPGFEALAMMRMMMGWAKAKGAKPPFRVESDNGVNFSPFVKRLGGARVDTPRYEIPF